MSSSATQRYEDDTRWNDLEISLNNIHSQSLLINQESSEQNGLLDGLSSFIDTINNKMSSGKKYFDKLSVTNDKQSICIAVLIVILVILFIVLILI
ncbi:hypothetical protein E3P96_02246 [Wallemia ichthyophaga]|nr:hypothetical protein E3P96_02246 [Wallemia ichthyophaga]